MLKVLPASHIKKLDSYTIEHLPIASIDLMERACRAFTTWFTEHFDSNYAVGVVCGTGNNGGDGMGIARLLCERGYSTKAWVVRGTASPSPDFQINLERASALRIEIKELVGESDQPDFADCDVLIDAMFGSGLSRPPVGTYARIIDLMNQAAVHRVAVDIPSGLMADSPSSGAIVHAAYTVSFQLPKLAFFLPAYHRFVGQWSLVDIGLHKDFLKKTPASYFYLTKKDPRKLMKARSTFSHKGNFGHALLIAGSHGKIGAAVLAARASLRSGLGRLTVHVPRCGYEIIQIAVPEAMVSMDQHDDCLSGVDGLEKYSTLAIGPGLGMTPETMSAFRDILQNFRKPMVIDADGLNLLSAHRELLHLIPENSILTPHPGEFERLVGEWTNDFERLEKQKELAARIKSFVVLKGAYSSIAAPDGMVYFNRTGNPGMATGGSGDVLTGILTGLMTQGYDSLRAAILGVYIHGLAGDLAVVDTGLDSLIATDLIDYLPSAFLGARRNK